MRIRSLPYRAICNAQFDVRVYGAWCISDIRET
jgi:hypothetical protein